MKKKKIRIEVERQIKNPVFWLIQVFTFGIIFGLPAIVNFESFKLMMSQYSLFGKWIAFVLIFLTGVALNYLVEYTRKKVE